jgi:hypothetical protein
VTDDEAEFEQTTGTTTGYEQPPELIAEDDEIFRSVWKEIDSEERERDAAENATASVSTAAPINDLDRNEVMAVIRELFTAGGPRDRETALRDVARALGYQRLGKNVRELIDNDLRTAVRRGILDNAAGELSLLCRTIDQYERDHLIDMLLAAMGSGWWDREAAITQAARHLGFRRTGKKIAAAFKSAINAALRRGLLEKDGPHLIRRT